MDLCILRGSHNKQRLFLYVALTGKFFFITEAESLYYAVRTGSLNQKDIVSLLKG